MNNLHIIPYKNNKSQIIKKNLLKKINEISSKNSKLVIVIGDQIV